MGLGSDVAVLILCDLGVLWGSLLYVVAKKEVGAAVCLAAAVLECRLPTPARISANKLGCGRILQDGTSLVFRGAVGGLCAPYCVYALLVYSV
jgi:hypothetical protein